jgi:hypothetical protein
MSTTAPTVRVRSTPSYSSRGRRRTASGPCQSYPTCDIDDEPWVTARHHIEVAPTVPVSVARGLRPVASRDGVDPATGGDDMTTTAKHAEPPPGLMREARSPTGHLVTLAVEGSTKILECAMLKTLGATECFKKF